MQRIVAFDDEEVVDWSAASLNYNEGLVMVVEDDNWKNLHLSS